MNLNWKPVKGGNKMAEASVVKIRKLNKSNTINVRVEITKGFKIRIMLAIGLIKIAGWVLGCGIHITKREDISKGEKQ